MMLMTVVLDSGGTAMYVEGEHMDSVANPTLSVVMLVDDNNFTTTKTTVNTHRHCISSFSSSPFYCFGYSVVQWLSK